MSPSEFAPILAQFGLEHVPLVPVDGGHINGTWRAGAWLLQRINPQVFPNGKLVIDNVAAVCDHLESAARRMGLDEPRLVLRVSRSLDGRPGVQGADGAWWRVLHYLENTRTFQRADSPEVAAEAGRAFGLFQRLLSDYSGPSLAETIPGFHDTFGRLGALQRAVEVKGARAGQVEAELRFVAGRAGYAGVIPPLIQSGELPRRVVHNDAKIANVLFDQSSSRALAVIDLDTVMPGTLLYDVGDLIRSMASPTDEDEPDISRISVSTPVVEALLRGYLDGCRDVLTETERRLLVFAGILLSYEQGVRFLTDYLDGDRYYQAARPRQNLDRARTQFALVAQLERRRAPLERRVEEIVRRKT